ncbi:MAG: glycosyltransferase family 4 protein [Acidobacteria bacterium]|nr:glycosyltransferase family 4 protein [Acidobacteriota bacterium]MBV9474767.1 glycosyltransferase family 4 protein [Acidobacteriota bacterium]
MNISYLVEDTAQSGGVRVQLMQADALIARGHRVRLVTKGLPLTWRSSRAEWVYVDDFRHYDARDQDFVVGTFWPTVPHAYEIAGTRAVHLCQGYEGAFSAYAPIRDQIEAAYRLPIPKLVVAKSLVPVCRQFTDDVTYVGQIVEEEFYRAVTPREHEPPRVLLSGQAQGDMKGIPEGYGAVAHARWFHQTLDLVRVSPWVPSREEPLDAVQEFHVGLTTAEMTRLMHSCDVLLAPNHREEGFGLPAAEAMASGIPCIVTAIPSYLSFDDVHDYALFAPEENAVELGERLIELLSDADLRERLRTRGREVAEQWRAEHVAARLEKFFEERRS